MMKHLAADLFMLFAVAAVAQQTPAPKPQLSWVAPQSPEVKRLADVLAGGKPLKNSKPIGAELRAQEFSRFAAVQVAIR
jgi:hypothetical protein